MLARPTHIAVLALCSLALFCALLFQAQHDTGSLLLPFESAVPTHALTADRSPPNPHTARLCVHIVANDIPPLHRRGRTLAHLRFRFQSEPARSCAELYVLDRLVHTEDRDEVVGLLAHRGLTAFDVVERPLLGARVTGEMLVDHSGALNLALEESKRRGSEWAVVLDPCVFVPKAAWAALLRHLHKTSLHTVVIPTARALTRTIFLSGDFRAQFTEPGEIPQFAIRPSSIGPNPFKPSPPNSSPVLDFLLARCANLYRFTGKTNKGCSRLVNKPVILLYTYPATQQMTPTALTPHLRRIAVALGAELLAAKARVAARLGLGLRPLDDDVAAVEVLAQVDAGHELVGGNGATLATTTLRDIAGLAVAKRLGHVHKGLAPPSSRMPRMLCGRVLGNDIPPLQMHGQTFTNLRYVLQHESPHKCDHVFVVNRIVYEGMADKLVRLLEANGYKLGSEILVREIDWSLPRDSITAKYLGDVNGARNLAWDEGVRRGVEWIDLVDGGEFATRTLWEDVIRKIQDPHSYSMLLKPMVRLCREQNPTWLNANTELKNVPATFHQGHQEAQVVLPANSSLRFDPKLEYGHRNKLSVLMRECGAAYVRSNADLGIASPCAVLEGITFRLFPYRAQFDVHHKPARKKSRGKLRNQGLKLLVQAGQYLWHKRNGETPSLSLERAFWRWMQHSPHVEWTDEGLKVPSNLAFVPNP